MELIKNWLSGNRNFIVGAILYKKFGTDENLKKLFSGKPDSYLQQRLADALSSLLEQPKIILQAPTQKDADEMPKSADPVLEAFRQEWLPLYQRMNYLRHQLDQWPGNSDEEVARREPLTFEILELEQKCMKIWERRDHYQKTGQLPEMKTNKAPVPENPVALGKMIETLKRNIRRNKQAAEKNPDNPTYPLKVKQYQAELDEILLKQTNNEETGK